jgi:hypothetical protein
MEEFLINYYKMFYIKDTLRIKLVRHESLCGICALQTNSGTTYENVSSNQTSGENNYRLMDDECSGKRPTPTPLTTSFRSDYKRKETHTIPPLMHF